MNHDGWRNLRSLGVVRCVELRRYQLSEGGVILPVRTGFPMGTKCVIRLAARYPHRALAMAVSSIGPGPPGVGTPCA
eukprot:976836-Pyramimonas_sp.AAC.1